MVEAHAGGTQLAHRHPGYMVNSSILPNKKERKRMEALQSQEHLCRQEFVSLVALRSEDWQWDRGQSLIKESGIMHCPIIWEEEGPHA